MNNQPTHIKVDFTAQHDAKLQALATNINKVHNKLQQYFAAYPLLFVYSMVAFFGGEKMDNLNSVIKGNRQRFGDEKNAFLANIAVSTNKYLDLIKELKAFEDEKL